MPHDTRSTTSSKSCRLSSAIGRGPPHEVIESIDVVLLRGRHLGHKLLSQHVERCHRRLEHVEVPGPDTGQKGRALHELVAGQGIEPAGRRAHRCGGWPGRPVAGRCRWPEESRSDRRARPARRRCRARARPWPRALASRRPAAAARPVVGGRPTSCRDERLPAARHRPGRAPDGRSSPVPVGELPFL